MYTIKAYINLQRATALAFALACRAFLGGLGVPCRHPWKIKRHPMPLPWRALSASLAAASFRTAAALAACALRCIKKAAAFIKRLKNVHNTLAACALFEKATFQYYRPTDTRPPTAAALRSLIMRRRHQRRRHPVRPCRRHPWRHQRRPVRRPVPVRRWRRHPLMRL